MSHRASMPASSGGKQVAIVQPQRRDHIEHNVPQNTTQATLWIESRKSSPRRRTESPTTARRTPTPTAAPPGRRALSARRSTPLRLTVLKRAQSATKMKVVKIEEPSKIDHTKQAAIMLMTGHTPRARLELALARGARGATPSYVLKKPSPVRKTPARKGRPSARGSAGPGRGSTGSKEAGDGITPKRRSVYQETRRSSRRGSGNNSVTILEITDSDSQLATSSSRVSSALPTPKKSSLKDFSKKSARKTESIKFDLSNLQNQQDDTTWCESEESVHDEDMTLHYSESSSNSSARSPSPRRPLHSRSGRMLEQVGVSLAPSPSRTLTPASPRSRTSARGSLMLQRALDGTDSDRSADATVASAFRTRTLSPRKNMESFSIVDLVSINSDTSQDRTKSIYTSIDSMNTTNYETPNASTRKSRSTIEPSLLGSSTPYARSRPARSTSIPELGRRSTRSSASARRSKSLSTPENRPVSALGGAPAARGTRSRSRINDTDLLLLDDTEMDDSPKSSRRSRAKDATATADVSKATDAVVSEAGESTPENRLSPVDAGTPVLSIQSFLDSSRSSNRSSARKGNQSRSTRRKTVGVPSRVKRRSAAKSKSLGATARRSILHRSFESQNQPEASSAVEDNVTPRASVRLEREAVKNQHSTAKKPQSRRSIIDDLERSDIVKQLFNSPVKRKLSRSMTEFERCYDDDDDVAAARRPARHTLATTGRGGDDSLSDVSDTFTPDRFVSPIGTPSHSPDLSGIKRLFQRSTPESDPRDLRGARSSLRKRKSIKNDLSDVTGVKLAFASSPRNRLSDVRVKEVFRRSPENDLRRVTGVKSLFGKERSPENDLSDVRGVKALFRRSPADDLRNVSGVKRTLRNSPRNDLTDVRGVGRMFRHGTRKRSEHDVSGVEELFDEAEGRPRSSEELFDRLVGKPTLRKVYSRTFCARANPERERSKGTLHISLERLPAAVLARELKVRRRDEPTNVTKEMQKLVTSTVEGEFPFLASRTRNSSLKKSASELYGAHTLPIKKRSLASPRAAPAPAPAPAPRLPLKKRVVLHSTPMKGRPDVTMNASELGRVSPIRALDNTHTHDTIVARTTRQKTIPEAAIAAGPSQAKTPQKSAKRSAKAPKASPPASPEARAAVRPKASPKKVDTPPKRSTRNRKNTTVNTSKKGRASLVIGKKAPVMSPQAGARASPPPRRAAARKQHQKPSTPVKRTRVAKGGAVVVLKPSPKLKPQADEASQAEDKPKRTRRNVVVHFESPKESQTKIRGKKNDPKGKENKTDNISAEKPKRGRKPAAVAEPPATRRGRGADASAQNVKTRGKSVTKADEPEVKQPKGRGKKAAAVEPPTVRRGRRNAEDISVEPQPKSRGKKTETPLEKVPKTRGKKIEIQSSTQPEPVARGRRAKVDKEVNTVPVPSPVENRRKRKTVPEEVVPAKVAKTVTRRGRQEPEPAPVTTADKKSAAVKPVVKPVAKPRATKDKDTRPGSKTRGKKVEVEKPAPAKATRGRKVAEPKESPVAEKRKRKANVEASPVKGKKAATSVAKKAEPAAGRTRAQAAEGGASGRSRRRR